MELHSPRPPRGQHEQQRARAHRHRAVVVHALGQRGGVPYEVERTVCPDCLRVLDERQLRRAAA